MDEQFQGSGTYADVPRHLDAASHIVSSRFLRTSGDQPRLFNILATESVLYHIFHASAGLWSDTEKSAYEFDLAFWERAEAVLPNSPLIRGTSTTNFGSPVLGVPTSLLRLILQLRLEFRNPGHLRDADICGLRQEVVLWTNTFLELSPLSDGELPISAQEKFNRVSSSLYALVASLLWGKVMKRDADSTANEGWQIQKALEILRTYKDDSQFTKSYIGNWPVYTLGVLSSCAEDRRHFQSNLWQRWKLTKLAHVWRFLSDLENTTYQCAA